MPTHIIPLALAATARGWEKSVGASAKDQQLINGLVEISANTIIGAKSVYVAKRDGSAGSSSVGASGEARILKSSYADRLYITNTDFRLFTGPNGVGDLGILGAMMGDTSSLNVCEALVTNGTVHCFTIGTTGWYFFENAASTNFPTFTGNRTSGSAIISGIASTTGIYPGQAISGTGIPADTRVLSVDSATQITMTANASSGAGTATTITKEAVAKVLDAQFPADPSNWVFLNGYFFVAHQANGKIFQSASNDPSSWQSADVISADYGSDGISFLFKIKEYILAAGLQGTIQYFYNAGNASGSVLSSAPHLVITGMDMVSEPVSIGGASYFIGSEGTHTTSSSIKPYALYRISGVNTIERVSDSIGGGIVTDGSNTFYALSTANLGDRKVLLINTSFTAPGATTLMYDPLSQEFSMLALASGSLLSSFESYFTKDGALTEFSWAGGNTWTDSSVAYTLTAQTAPQEFSGTLGAVDVCYELMGADTESTGTATLEVSDDDGANWSTVGAFDMTAAKKIIWGGGWHRGPRAYRITHSANTNFRAQALKITWK